MNGAELFADVLSLAGVDTFFGLPGSTEAALLEAFRARSDLRYVLGLHEGAVVSMADGYARVSGRPGVVGLHTTVGTLNGASQIYNAFRDGSAVVVTAGHKDRTVLSEDGFCAHQHLPEAVRPFTKWAHQTLSAAELGPDLWRALHVAMTSPRGPSYLAVPEDFFRGQVPDDAPAAPISNAAMWTDQGGVGDQMLSAAAAAALATATWPVIVVGSQARGCVAELRVLADILAAPLVCTDFSDLADLPFPTADERYLGLYGEEPGVLDGCDLVLAVGARMFYPFSAARHPLLPAGARLVHIYPDAAHVGARLPTDVGIAASPVAALRSVLAELGTGPDPAGLEARRKRLADLRSSRETKKAREREADSTDPLGVDRLSAELNQVIPADAIIVDEGVRSSTRLLRHLEVGDGQLMLRSSGGGLGWGVPAAVGAAIAEPSRPVVALVGDGSFQFSVQAVWSAVREQVNLTVVVLDNGGYLAVKSAIERYLRVPRDDRVHPGTRLPGIDHAAVASGYGATGVAASRPGDVAAAVKQATEVGGTTVISVKIAEVRP